jgi:hypothetical protein
MSSYTTKMSTEPQNGSAYRYVQANLYQGGPSLTVCCSASAASTHHAISSWNGSGDEVYQNVAAHHQEVTGEKRRPSQTSTDWRREDTRINGDNHRRPQIPHYSSSGGNGFISPSQTRSYNGQLDDFPPVMTECPYNGTRYPSEVYLEDAQNPSIPTPVDLISTCPSHFAIETRPYTPRAVEHSNNSYPSTSDSIYYGTRNDDALYLPASPTAQRYFNERTPEERIRLGLPRFQTQQEYDENYRLSTHNRP